MRRVSPRPESTIPPKQEAALIAAGDNYRAAKATFELAEREFIAACDAAFQAGGSHSVIARVGKIAKSTAQKYTTPRSK